MATATPPRTSDGAIFYPTEDGQPMAETDKHRDIAVYIIEALKTYFRNQSNVYVSGNNFVYWREGDPRSRVSPDAYVVFGVEMRQRDNYKAWEEQGRLPDVVFEFTSKSTRREDTDTKLPLCEQTLRVPEYFLFDPTGDYLRPRLQGYRLEGGHYVRLEGDGDRLHSERLGLDLVREGEALRLYDPVRGQFLRTPQEEAQRAEEASRRAEEAEARLAQVLAEMEALRRQS